MEFSLVSRRGVCDTVLTPGAKRVALRARPPTLRPSLVGPRGLQDPYRLSRQLCLSGLGLQRALHSIESPLLGGSTFTSGEPVYRGPTFILPFTHTHSGHGDRGSRSSRTKAPPPVRIDLCPVRVIGHSSRSYSS